MYLSDSCKSVISLGPVSFILHVSCLFSRDALPRRGLRLYIIYIDNLCQRSTVRSSPPWVEFELSCAEAGASQRRFTIVVCSYFNFFHILTFVFVFFDFLESQLSQH